MICQDWLLWHFAFKQNCDFMWWFSLAENLMEFLKISLRGNGLKNAENH